MNAVKPWSVMISDADTEVNLDGVRDKQGVEFIGSARKQPDGTWVALANVGGALCRVEVVLTPHPKLPSTGIIIGTKPTASPKAHP